MSFDIFAEPTVKSPGDESPRKGRGFSRTEIEQAGLTIPEARRMGLSIDIRRKTTHSENVEALKVYTKDLEKLAKAVKVEKAPSVDEEAALTELSSLRAVKKAEAELLVKVGILTLSDLAYCDIPKVAKRTGIDEERITAMVKAALSKV